MSRLSEIVFSGARSVATDYSDRITSAAFPDGKTLKVVYLDSGGRIDVWQAPVSPSKGKTQLTIAVFTKSDEKVLEWEEILLTETYKNVELLEFNDYKRLIVYFDFDGKEEFENIDFNFQGSPTKIQHTRGISITRTYAEDGTTLISEESNLKGIKYYNNTARSNLK